MSATMKIVNFFRKCEFLQISGRKTRFWNASSSGIHTTTNRKDDSPTEITEQTSVIRDVEGIFLNPRVQEILLKITGIDAHKVNRPRKERLKPPKYELLSDEQLKQVQAEAMKTVVNKLKMPPVMNPRKQIETVLTKNPELEGLDDCKFLFTDISPGHSDRERLIIAREPDGTLRNASWAERQKALQIYFPKHGRKLRTPHMFEEEHLNRILKEERYEYILERALIQFEPDDPHYIHITHKVYDFINDKKHFDHLRSTRHFGCMTLHFTIQKTINNLLVDTLQSDLLDNAADLVRLYTIVHPECATSQTIKDNASMDSLELIKIYAEKDATHHQQGDIELALQSYEEVHPEVSTS
ncbi:small ribosomal subunit protein mS22-like [Tubulanus polymorphus]|uniref:small ribosomal subunit protein mS22-like n=1 Tax=Tubulanus polymorphus TaxID=672921 RepID=UPI003DA57A76